MVTDSVCSFYKYADDILEFCSLSSIHFKLLSLRKGLSCSLADFQQNLLYSKQSRKLCIYQSCSQAIPSAFLGV